MVRSDGPATPTPSRANHQKNEINCRNGEQQHNTITDSDKSQIATEYHFDRFWPNATLSAFCFKRFTIFQNILTKLSIIFKSCFDLTCKFTPRFNFLFQEYFSFTVSWLNRGQDWDGGSWEKLIKIMLQSYYNIKIMLIVYSLDQYVFLIMEYI